MITVVVRMAPYTSSCPDAAPPEWDLPPKPKWMRWRTYQRYVDKYDHYEGVLDEGTFAALARLLRRS
jgi:hypothetical protein